MGLRTHMAETTQTTATAPAPTAGSPTPVGTSTEAQTSSTAPLTPLDFERLLKADLEGSPMSAAEQEQQGTPTEETQDPLQQELDAETEETPDTPADEEPQEKDDQTDDANTESDEEPVPKGMEDWPKQAVKRIQKQSETIRALKAQVAQGGLQIAPTEASPLADVQSVTDLDARINSAKGIRAWCRENPDGGTIRMSNGATFEITPEMAAEKLAKAEREIDAYADRKLWLAEREKTKPWEAAEAVAPGILQQGTQENSFYENVLKAVPELAAKLPDYEVFVACAARGMKQMIEEQQGRAKYVRMELKDGKVVATTPKSSGTSKASPASAGKPASTQATTPFRPSNQRPQASAAGASPSANLAALEARAAQGDETARRQLLRAELTAA